jgi:hypothetical protein
LARRVNQQQIFNIANNFTNALLIPKNEITIGGSPVVILAIGVGWTLLAFRSSGYWRACRR